MELLNDFQKNVLQECLEKGSGGLSLPMGSGKTLISLVMSKKLQPGQKTLVVASKILVNSWVDEIQKFFKKEIKYHVFHNDFKNTTSLQEADIVIVTPETLVKYYKLYNIGHHLIEFRTVQVTIWMEATTNYYCSSSEPFLNENKGEYLAITGSNVDKEGLCLYTSKWGLLIVDEVQNHINLSSEKCKAIASISAYHRWLLSGTILSEPKPERIFGYYLLLNHPTFPRTLPDAKRHLQSIHFKGINETLVKREKNEGMIKAPRLIQRVVQHDLTRDEAIVYLSIRDIMNEFKKEYLKYKACHNTVMARKFSAYMMALFGYLRQSLVCPIIPLASACIDSLDISTDNTMANIMIRAIRSKVSSTYLDDKRNLCSSRIQKVMETLALHPDEKIVLFSCYRTSIDLIGYFVAQTRTYFTIQGSDSLPRRNEILSQFKDTPNGVLCLTYELGSEGLNLQHASTVLLVDFFWNDGKTSQAIARVLRYGQLSETVHAYLFTAGTGIEKAIFNKQQAKLDIIKDLETGSSKKSIPKMSIHDVLKMINSSENEEKLLKIRNV
jgi:SNF2 family DNA or RNA helicase